MFQLFEACFQLTVLPFQFRDASIALDAAKASRNIRAGVVGIHAAGIICTAVKTLNNYHKTSI